MKIFLSISLYFLLITGDYFHASANTKFIGQLECKRSDDHFIWDLKINEETEEVLVKHRDDLILQYNFSSSSDTFYFSRTWIDLKMRHEFIIDRITAEFETITTYDDVSKQFKEKGVCKKQERAF